MSAALPVSPGLLAIPSTLRGARRDLIDLMSQICRESGADRYMLIDLTVRAGDRARIVASNWIYDAIDMIGLDLVARLVSDRSAEGAETTTPSDQALLADYGHVELMGLPLRASGRRYALLLTAESTGRLIDRARAKIELLCRYALSMLGSRLGDTPVIDPLTERERECLFWVSEGKTTEEVSVILGVSTSTANSHLTNAMQKLGARNRALAIATAIRLGVI